MHAKLRNSFPHIAGVTNAAMVLSDRLFSDMTVEHLNMVLEPKVTGTANLDELFSTPTLDFFVTSSFCSHPWQVLSETVASPTTVRPTCS